MGYSICTHDMAMFGMLDARMKWKEKLIKLIPTKQEEQKHSAADVFGQNLHFEKDCECVAKCLSVHRMIKCLHVFNGNLEESEINKILAKNTQFVNDYQHILSVHLDSRNEFANLYNFVSKQIRHIELEQNHDLRLPKESESHTFYINAMYVIQCYFFGNLV